MAQFTKPQTTKLFLPSTVNLPEEDQAWVLMRSKILMEDLIATNDIKDDTERGMTMLARLIQDWNYVNDNGDKEAITAENLNHFEKLDYDYLDNWIADQRMSQQEGLSQLEKKASSATSTPSSAKIPPTTPPQPTT